MKRFAILLSLAILCIGCSSKDQTDTHVPKHKSASSPEDKKFCYSVQIGNHELNFLEVDRIETISITQDVELYKLLSECPILSFDGTEVWFVQTLPEDLYYLNNFSFGCITAVTSNSEMDLICLSDYLLSDATDVTKIHVLSVPLDPSLESDIFRDVFPEYDNESVISYALINLEEEQLAVVQQVDEGSTVEYQYLGLDGLDCRVTMLNKLIIEDTGAVIDIVFQDNPNYKPTAL